MKAIVMEVMLGLVMVVMVRGSELCRVHDGTSFRMIGWLVGWLVVEVGQGSVAGIQGPKLNRMRSGVSFGPNLHFCWSSKGEPD